MTGTALLPKTFPPTHKADRVMTPDEFIAKWRSSKLKESSASQEHFIDLCHLVGEPTPAEADPEDTWYCFERGARKDTGGDGWADVWKHRHFAWEYKGRQADLDLAFDQLRRYALALENPLLLIVSGSGTCWRETSQRRECRLTFRRGLLATTVSRVGSSSVNAAR